MAEEEAQLNTATDDHQREENQGKLMIQQEEDDDGDASHIWDGDTNSSLLPGLNLALIISSLAPSESQSHQEFQNLHKNPQGQQGEIKMLQNCHAKDQNINTSLNIPRVRRQAANHGIRGVEKKMMPNPNIKIRACRFSAF